MPFLGTASNRQKTRIDQRERNVNRFGRGLLAGMVLMGVSAVGFAQGYPVPAKTTDTPVPCTTCYNGGPGTTVGYKTPIGTFSGRYLDSSSTTEWFDYGGRTLRAVFVLVRPDLGRIYFRFGNGTMAAYSLNTFFSRLESGEQLMFPLGTFPDRSGNPEVILRWDEWFAPVTPIR